jgi:hypothetical protein
LLALYELRPRLSAVFASGLLAANISLTVAYPLLCTMPENQNIAQAVGYWVQEQGEAWGGPEAIAFYYPTGSLYAYLPEALYPRTPAFEGLYTFEGCEPQSVLADSMQGIQMIIAIPSEYDMRQDLNWLLDYAVEFDCEQARLAAVEAYALANDFLIVGQVVDAEGQVHANFYSTLALDVGQISLEAANQWHYERYSRASWVKP